MHRTSLLLAFAAATGALLAPSPTVAQTCAMLPPGRPAEGPAPPAAARATAIDAVTRALEDAGVQVIATAEAQRRMVGEPYAECAALDCGGSVVRRLGVDYAVLVTVWAPRGTPTVVVVTLIGENDSAAGDAPVVQGDVAAAALNALATARQRWQAAQMGFVDVRSTPEGADVEVDGRLVGRTPVRHLVMAGERRVRVELAGFEPVEQVVHVVPMREHPVAVTLSPASDVSAPEPITRTEPHLANWVLGGALVLGGVVALISPLHTLAVLDQCVDAHGLPEGYCRSTATFGAQSGILLGIGAAALAGGIVVMVAQPLQATTVVTPDAAWIQLSGTF